MSTETVIEVSQGDIMTGIAYWFKLRLYGEDYISTEPALEVCSTLFYSFLQIFF